MFPVNKSIHDIQAVNIDFSGKPILVSGPHNPEGLLGSY